MTQAKSMGLPSRAHHPEQQQHCLLMLVPTPAQGPSSLLSFYPCQGGRRCGREDDEKELVSSWHSSTVKIWRVMELPRLCQPCSEAVPQDGEG